MAVEIQCPECDNPLKVPDEVLGKKIKCKQCGTAFVAKDPRGKPSKPGGGGAAAKPTKPGAGASVKKEKAPEPQKEEPKPAPATFKLQDDDDDEGGAKPNPLGVIAEEDVPRCPFCAKELDPPDAIVCLHCGFNNVTRVRAESKKVWAPDSSDWMNHLAPGILALVGFIALIVLDVIVFLNMEDWLRGSFLESDQADVTDPSKKKLLVKPGAFITLIFAATVMPIIGFGRFAFKRLAIEYMPSEKLKK